MKIGELAQRTGLSVDTLRFYEKIGLIQPPARDDGGRRDYGADMLGWVGFLAQLSATGMKQADRILYAQLRHRGDATVKARREMLEAHRTALATRLEEMVQTLRLMDDKIETYRQGRSRSGNKGQTIMTDALTLGREMVKQLNPDLERVLSERFDADVKDFSESLIEWAYGRHYARPGLDLRTRQLCTVAALTALGGQTAPQLKVNIRHARAVGATEAEIFEAIWQMAVYGGVPAAINGLNAAQEVFAEARGVA